MQFFGITSGLFSTLLLSLGAAVVLLYVVKLRRRRITVPFSPLWQKVLVERRTQSFWRRLKRWFSMIVHLLILLLLLVALRDPRPEDVSTEQRNVLLIIDTSASMAAHDQPGGRDRMEAAREAAVAVIDSLSADDNLMAVSLGAQLEPLSAFSRPTASTRAEVAGLEYRATSADFVEAMRFASRSLAGRTAPELVVISDFAYPEEELEAAAAVDMPREVEPTFIQIGEQSGNLAVSRFNVRRYLANRLNYEVYVQLTSTFDAPVTAELTILANGIAVEQMTVDLDPDSQVIRVYPNLPTGGNQLEARVEIVGGDAVDVFSLDDSAYALLPEERQTSILLVSDDNLFVEAPLLLNQNLNVDRLSPAEYESAPLEQRNQYDVSVFNRFTPSPPDRGGALYIAPDGENSPWEVRGQTSDPIIDRFDRNDPLMRWMHSFRSLNILTAQRLTRTSDDHAAATSIRGDPMFLRRGDSGQRLAAIAFAIEDSDFGLRPAYPLFMLNVIDWLSSDAGSLIEGYKTGRAEVLALSDATPELVLITPPIGPPSQSPVLDDSVTVYPEWPGFYSLYYDATEASEDSEQADLMIAANMFDLQESDISVGILPAGAEDAPDLQQSTVLGHREPWVYLLLVSVFLLLIEWVTFNRRMTV